MKNILSKVWGFIKKYKFILLAIILLIIIIFVIVKFVYPEIHKRNLTNENWLRNHIDIVLNDNYGENIYYVEKDKDIDIFTETYQNIIEDKIKELLNNNDYTLEEPLMIVNPYGTNSSGINIYYNSEDNATLDYTIKADDTTDFTRTLIEKDGPDYEYQIIGLVPGKENNLTLELKKDDEVVQTKEISIDMPNTDSDVDVQLDVENGDSKAELTDGLYALLGHDKNFNSNIYLYDNDGTLRSELDLDSYRTDRIIFIDNDMIYCYKKDGFIRVDSTGKIVDFYDIDGYIMHHDFVYDEDNNKLVILANKAGADTIEDRVITLDLDTKKVEEVLDMHDYLSDFYDTATVPEQGNTYGGDELDWIHLNSLQVIDGKDILLSSRETSSIIRINNFYDNPEIEYLLVDDSMLEGTSYEDLAYEKVGDFVSHAGQHTVTYTTSDDLEDGQYYITIFNNNYGGARTRPDFDWSNYPGVGTYEDGTHSMFYKYLVDENEKTYELVDSFDVPYSSIVSSIEYFGDNIVVSSGKDHSFGEYDEDGNLIRQFNYTSKKYAYRAFKYTFGDVWFD